MFALSLISISMHNREKRRGEKRREEKRGEKRREERRREKRLSV